MMDWSKYTSYERCPRCGTVCELEVSRTCTHFDWDVVKDEPIHEFELDYRLVCPDLECRWKGERHYIADVVLTDNYEEETKRPWGDE